MTFLRNIAVLILSVAPHLAALAREDLFGNEGDPVYSQGLAWTDKKEAVNLPRDKYVVDYDVLGSSKVFQASDFLKEADEMNKQIESMFLNINVRPEELDHKGPFTGKQPEGESYQERYFAGKLPDRVSSEIQATAGCCKLLHAKPVESEKVKIRLRARMRLYDMNAKGGSLNFLVEVEIRVNSKVFRSYFYIWEFMQFSVDGDEWRDWRNSAVTFRVVDEKLSEQKPAEQNGADRPLSRQ